MRMVESLKKKSERYHSEYIFKIYKYLIWIIKLIPSKRWSFFKLCPDKNFLNQINILNLQIICLSASANKLSNIQKQAEEYAALIMEELDPEHKKYIMVQNPHTRSYD